MNPIQFPRGKNRSITGTPIPQSTFKEVDLEQLGKTDRGEGGFGSTGRF